MRVAGKAISLARQAVVVDLQQRRQLRRWRRRWLRLRLRRQLVRLLLLVPVTTTTLMTAAVVGAGVAWELGSGMPRVAGAGCGGLMAGW